MLCNATKIVLCGRHNTFATFSEDALQFSWQAQHVGRLSSLCVAGTALSTRPVACFFANRIGRAASSGDRVQIPWQALHFGEVLKINRSLVRNIDFEIATFEVPKKTRRKKSILKLQSVKISGSFARNAQFSARMCLVSSLSFSYGLAVSMGEVTKRLLFEDFQAGYYVVLRGSRGTL